jgi:solute carrier family 13 (sodium-dependent dicarboxylate transporter), member 2/3/5
VASANDSKSYPAIPAAPEVNRALDKGTVSLVLRSALCIIVPLAVWLAPLHLAPGAQAALAISAFMILAWITEVMEYAAAGLIGLMLFWVFHVAKPAVIFSGFVNDASWFYLGAMLLGAMVLKSGLPQRIANWVISHVGVTYSRLLLGLIIVDFLLTFIVPSGAAVIVIMALISISLIQLFGVDKGSNIGRGMFLVITYTTSIFNKMIVAGTASIIARAIIGKTGGVQVSWSLWFIAFLPCALVTILGSWWLALRMFPPEVNTLAGREEEVKQHFRTSAPWTPMAIKSAILSGAALVLWMTDSLHHVSASIVAFAIGLFALLPFIEVLNEKDFRQVNMLPFFFVAAALGMGQVLTVTGGLNVVTDGALTLIKPLLDNELVAVITLYWGGFFYHFATASEVSMLATSMPILMEFSRQHALNPAWVGMIWSFSSGGKLFAYQSAVLVLGYSYGYFRPLDLVKMGAALTVIEFVLLAISVFALWPMLGTTMH